MIKGIFKKADLILLAVLVIGGLFASLAVARAGGDTGSVVIKAAGKTAGTYALDEDRTLLITADGDVQEIDDGNADSAELAQQDGSRAADGSAGYNIVQINDGQVSMIEADCHNQVCVNHKPITKSNESIICLPHKVVVEISGKEADDGYDTIAQ